MFLVCNTRLGVDVFVVRFICHFFSVIKYGRVWRGFLWID